MSEFSALVAEFSRRWAVADHPLLAVGEAREVCGRILRGLVPEGGLAEDESVALVRFGWAMAGDSFPTIAVAEHLAILAVARQRHLPEDAAETFVAEVFLAATEDLPDEES